MLISAAVLAAAACFFAYRLWKRLNTPAERERRRRLLVHAKGRTADGAVTDISDDDTSGETLIHYRYVIGGVEYSAAQDVSLLRDMIGDPRQFLGPTAVKYSPGRPADSIVVCEEWSGLRGPTD